MSDPSLSPAAEAEIAALRAAIDAIDDTLHDLLMRRAAVVAQLAESRAKGDGPPLRPGREAAVLRRLLRRHTGPLERRHLVRIWREIFMAGTAIQGPFSVAVDGSQAAPLQEAYRHFGPITPIRSHATAARALEAVAAGEASVAVLPAPTDTETIATAWWAHLAVPQLQVIARLPIFGPSEEGSAFVIAPLAPDASGADRSLLRLEVEREASRGTLLAELAAVGLPPTSLLLLRSAGENLALAEVEGLLGASDARLAHLPWRRCSILGAYALPIAGDDR